MAHVQIARNVDPKTGRDLGWSLMVDGVEIADKISPDGLSMRFDAATMTWVVSMTLRAADALSADLPSAVIEALAADA